MTLRNDLSLDASVMALMDVFSFFNNNEWFELFSFFNQ